VLFNSICPAGINEVEALKNGSLKARNLSAKRGTYRERTGNSGWLEEIGTRGIAANGWGSATKGGRGIFNRMARAREVVKREFKRKKKQVIKPGSVEREGRRVRKSVLASPPENARESRGKK